MPHHLAIRCVGARQARMPVPAMKDYMARCLNAQPVAPGWPRPRGACTADRGTSNESKERPIPWVALVDDDGWDPWAFDPVRGKAMEIADLCQVCGAPRGPVVYALASAGDAIRGRMDSVEHYGGALCSVRCARLTAAVCPRYRAQWPVGVYAVAKAAARVGLCDSDYPTDDAYDLRGMVPVAVLGADLP